MRKRLNRLYSKVVKAPFIRDILRWSKKTSLPGFKQVPIYYVTKFFIQELQKESITIRANSIAYSFFIALFPFILFLITLVSFLQFRSVTEYLNTLHESIQPVIPKSMDAFIFDDVINGIFTLHRGDLLSLGVILAIYFASNGVLSLIHGFEKKYESYNRRNILKQRLIAIILTIILGFLLFIGLSLILISENVVVKMLEIAKLDRFSVTIILVARWVIILGLFYSIISIIYRFGPNLKTKSSYFSPGANVATIGIVITSLVFAYYLNRFGRYNAIYGSLGAIIITLLMIQINASIILIGYELNASIAVNRDLLMEKDIDSTEPNGENNRDES